MSSNSERYPIVEVFESDDGYDIVIFERDPDGVVEPNYDQQGNPIYIDEPCYFFMEGQLQFGVPYFEPKNNQNN